MYQAPRGTTDILPEEQAYWRYVEQKAVDICQLYGYERIDSPMFEEAGLQVTAVRELSKELEFHDWADRQHVSETDKEKLLEMMRNIPRALNPLFAPRWVAGTMYFTLHEAVLIARLPRN